MSARYRKFLRPSKARDAASAKAVSDAIKSRPRPADCGRPHPQQFCVCIACRDALALARDADREMLGADVERFGLENVGNK